MGTGFESQRCVDGAARVAAYPVCQIGVDGRLIVDRVRVVSGEFPTRRNDPQEAGVVCVLLEMAEEGALEDMHDRAESPRHVLVGSQSPFGSQVAAVDFLKEAKQLIECFSTLKATHR